MNRRRAITLLGGAAAAWPLAARAQQGERMRRIGMIMPAASDDPEYPVRIGAFLQEMQQLGWIIGRNMRIDIRWTSGNADNAHKYAAELVRSPPTSSLPLVPQPSALCCRQHAVCRSYSQLSAIRSRPASSTVWRGRAVTPPGSWRLNTL